MLKYLWVIFLLLILNQTSNAQVNGCLLPDNRVYTTADGYFLLNPTPVYSSSNYQDLIASYCTWIPNFTSGSCYVCPGDNFTLNFLGIKIGCNSGVMTGTVGSFIMECDLDLDLYLIFISVATIAILQIRRAQFLN